MVFNILNLTLIMLLNGIGSFGGGIGAVNIIKDCIINWNWISESEFLKVVSFSQYNGYAQGIMLSSYLGEKLGIIGAIISVIAFILPSILLIITILKIGEKLYKNDIFQHSLKYINLLAAGLIGIIFYNYIALIFSIDPIIYLAVAGIACFLNIRFNANSGLIVLGGAVIGAIWRA